MKEYHMTTPLTKEDLKKLVVGDIVYISGDVFTSRDAAHQRYKECLENNVPLPIDLNGKTLFYAGPCPTPPHRNMGSTAPTSSVRMDPYVEMTFKLGVPAMIGKGDRSPYVADLCKQYEGVYFIAIGGASAMISNQVKSVEVLAYEDLGTESVKRVTVEDLRCIVGIDTNGRVFQDEQKAIYKKD